MALIKNFFAINSYKKYTYESSDDIMQPLLFFLT